MSSKLVLVNELARASMQSVEPLKCVYELCDYAFSKGTFIHEWIYNVKQLVRLLVRYYNASTRNGHKKKNLGNSSEPPNDNGQPSPPKRSQFYNVYYSATGIAEK